MVAQFASAAPIVLPQSRKRKPPPLALPISPLPLPRALPPSSTPSSSHASSPSLSSISSHASSSPSFPSPPRFIDNLLPRAPPLLHSPFSPNTVSKIRRLSQDHLLLLAGHAVQAPVVLHPAPCLLCIDCPSPQCPGESNRLAKAAQIAAHAKPPSTLRRKTVIAILPSPAALLPTTSHRILSGDARYRCDRPLCLYRGSFLTKAKDSREALMRLRKHKLRNHGVSDRAPNRPKNDRIDPTLDIDNNT